jgi:hypothetical protein
MRTRGICDQYTSWCQQQVHRAHCHDGKSRRDRIVLGVFAPVTDLLEVEGHPGADLDPVARLRAAAGM